MSLRDKTPFPIIGLESLIDARVQPPLSYSYSGELKAVVGESPLGAVRKAGRIRDVWLSVRASGKHDGAALMVSGDVLINGTSCLSTYPCVSHVSGETSQQKTTKMTGDTGITQAVIDTDHNIVAPGDVITAKFYLTRTASQIITEISNPTVVVEFEPVSGSPNAF